MTRQAKTGRQQHRESPGVTKALRRAYRLLRKRHGHQQWWPGETRFEICVGAILTQNTSWKNVEQAIANLKRASALEPKALFRLPHSELAELIRPAGYFNVKANRLRAFLKTLNRQFNGDIDAMLAGPTTSVRDRLLAISGIGPETADSMLLYAGNHHSFVIDAYTKRIFTRHGWCHPDADYDALQRLCERSLSQKSGEKQLDYWQDYHAQLVMVGKDYCRPKQPLCKQCPLSPLLPEDEDQSSRAGQ